MVVWDLLPSRVGKARSRRGSRTILVWNGLTMVMWNVLRSRVGEARSQGESKIILASSCLLSHMSFPKMFEKGKTVVVWNSLPRGVSKAKVLTGNWMVQDGALYWTEHKMSVGGLVLQVEGPQLNGCGSGISRHQEDHSWRMVGCMRELQRMAQ